MDQLVHIIEVYSHLFFEDVQQVVDEEVEALVGVGAHHDTGFLEVLPLQCFGRGLGEEVGV